METFDSQHSRDLAAEVDREHPTEEEHDPLQEIRESCDYDPEGDSPVDNLIAYKDALEDEHAATLVHVEELEARLAQRGTPAPSNRERVDAARQELEAVAADTAIGPTATYQLSVAINALIEARQWPLDAAEQTP